MPKFFLKRVKPEKSTLKVEKERRVESLRTLLSWEAPAWSYRRRGHSWFRSVLAIALAAIVVLFFIKDFLFIVVVAAFVFLVFVLVTVPPQRVEHKITTQGLVSAGHSYSWADLKSFWFSQKDKTWVLNIQTNLKFPGRIFLLLEKVNKEEVKKILEKYLVFKEFPEMNWMDRAAETLVNKLPLEEKK